MVELTCDARESCQSTPDRTDGCRRNVSEHAKTLSVQMIVCVYGYGDKTARQPAMYAGWMPTSGETYEPLLVCSDRACRPELNLATKRNPARKWPLPLRFPTIDRI